jgi:uncharacterized protein (TIGR02246 family)
VALISTSVEVLRSVTIDDGSSEMTERPVLAVGHDGEAVEEFVAGMQAAIDASDADLFNGAFARDVLWGSPFGAIVDGYDQIHAIHSQMFAAAAGARQAQAQGSAGGSRYEIEHARLVAEDVAIAYVRRLSLAKTADEQPGRADAFDELALFVLVRRDGVWWLAAGLHTPDRRDVYR